MNKVDWSKAPDGDVRYSVEIDAWLEKKTDGIWYIRGGDGHLYRGPSQPLAREHWRDATPRPEPATPTDVDATITQRGELNDGDKYERTLVALCGTHVKTDVYRVLDAFKTGDPTLDHLIKKALCAGLRGHKNKLIDYQNIVESAQKALTLLEQKNNGK
jgi:hypothetical protein